MIAEFISPETLGFILIAVLLCVAGIEFIEVSIDRIQNPVISSPGWWMMGLILFTIIIKEFTARRWLLCA